jgi:hypothetical protein
MVLALIDKVREPLFRSIEFDADVQNATWCCI